MTIRSEGNRIRGVESVADKEAHTVQIIKINSQPGPAHMEFKVDSWHYDRVFSKYFNSPISIILPVLLQLCLLGVKRNGTAIYLYQYYV
jgi:hypothetical protein